jgi:hypothetical protein
MSEKNNGLRITVKCKYYSTKDSVPEELENIKVIAGTHGVFINNQSIETMECSSNQNGTKFYILGDSYYEISKKNGSSLSGDEIMDIFLKFWDLPSLGSSGLN